MVVNCLLVIVRDASLVACCLLFAPVSYVGCYVLCVVVCDLLIVVCWLLIVGRCLWFAV